MRAVFWKELRELLMASMVIVAFAVHDAFDPDRWHSRAFVAAIIIGVVHAVLDRFQRRDSFYRHRPVSGLNFHVARSLAGLVAACLPVVAFEVVHRIARPEPQYESPTLADALAAALLGWAVARSAITARDSLVPLLIALLPLMAHQFVEYTASAGLAALVGAVFAMHATLRLTGGVR